MTLELAAKISPLFRFEGGASHAPCLRSGVSAERRPLSEMESVALCRDAATPWFMVGEQAREEQGVSHAPSRPGSRGELCSPSQPSLRPVQRSLRAQKSSPSPPQALPVALPSPRSSLQPCLSLPQPLPGTRRTFSSPQQPWPGTLQPFSSTPEWFLSPQKRFRSALQPAKRPWQRKRPSLPLPTEP